MTLIDLFVLITENYFKGRQERL